MNILLTGGAGYIGSHACVALVEAGHFVVIFDNFCNSSLLVIRQIEALLCKSVTLVRGDIRNTELLKSTFSGYKIDAVIHCAGLKAVGESAQMPLAYYENNVQGTLSLLRAMQYTGTKNLVFSSSATVYGNPQYLPIDEVHPLAPTNPYGRTKYQIEQILGDLAMADPEMKIVNLRYFNPVGAHSSGMLGENPQGIPNNLMPLIAMVASGSHADLDVFGDDYHTEDGTGVRDYIHIEDLADGHVAAIGYLIQASGFEVFNLGTGVGYSVLQMIGAYEQVCGKKIPYRVTSKRPGDIAACYAEASKANRILGWKAKKTLLQMCSSSWFFEGQSKTRTLIPRSTIEK